MSNERIQTDEMFGPEWPPRAWAGTPAVGMCPDCGYPIVETPDHRDTRHDHCGPLPHTGPVGGPYCDQCG